MAKYKRKKVFIDPEVQGALIKQTILQWSCYFAATFAFLLLWQIMSVGGVYQTFGGHVRDTMARHTPVFCVLLLLVPALVWDTVRLSHRFAGPFYRLRVSLRKLAEGEEVPPLSFRKGDYWCDVANDFNAVRNRIAAQEAAASPETAPEPSPCERNLERIAELCGQVC